MADVLGDSLGVLRPTIINRPYEQQAQRYLDLPGVDIWAPCAIGQVEGLVWDRLECVVKGRIHDAHGLWWNAHVRANLLQNLVNTGGITQWQCLIHFFFFLLGFRGHFLGTLFAKNEKVSGKLRHDVNIFPVPWEEEWLLVTGWVSYIGPTFKWDLG